MAKSFAKIFGQAQLTGIACADCGLFLALERIRTAHKGWLAGNRLLWAENEEDAEQDESGASESAEGDGFRGREVSECDGNDGVDVGIAGDARCGHVAKQPDVGREGQQRSEDNQVELGLCGAQGDVGKRMEFSEGGGEHKKPDASEHHGGAGSDRARFGHVERTVKDGAKRPADRSQEHRDARDETDGSAIHMEQKNAHAGKAQERGDDRGCVKVLLAQDDDFEDQGEDGDGCRQDRDDTRGDVLFCPEERAILGDEHDKARKGKVAPLPRGGWCGAFGSHKEVKRSARDEKAHTRCEKGRKLRDGDANGKERSSPEEVDGEKGRHQAQAERPSGGESYRIGNH